MHNLSEVAIELFAGNERGHGRRLRPRIQDVTVDVLLWREFLNARLAHSRLVNQPAIREDMVLVPRTLHCKIGGYYAV